MATSDQPLQKYAIHQLHLETIATHPRLSQAVAKILGDFASSRPQPTHFTLGIHVNSPDASAVHGYPQLRKFWSGVLPGGLEMAYYAGPDHRLIELSRKISLLVDLAARKGDAKIAPGAERLLLDGCIIPLLSEIMRLKNQHILHAASLASGPQEDSRAVMICGPAGSGKTTTALSLWRSGMAMLTDDVTFVVDPRGESRDPPLRVWGFPHPCKVSEKTFELLPWLREVPARPRPSGGEYSLDLKFPGRARQEFIPAAIVFLETPNQHEHKVRPLNKVSAIERVTSENIRAYDKRGSGPAGDGFRALTRLVTQCNTYTLSAGPDPENLLQIILPLMN